MRFPPSSTALQHYVDLVGLETRPFPNPLAARAPPRPSSTSRASRTTPTSVDDLPQVYHDVMHAWNACLEEGADFSDMNRAMRERDVAAHPRDLVEARREARQPDVLRVPLRLRVLQVLPAPRDLRPGRLRHRRLGHRLPELHPGDPARRLHRAPTTTTAASSAAPSSCRCGCGSASRRRSCTGRTAPRSPTLHGSRQPRPAVTRLHRTAGNRITVTDASGDIRTYQAAIFTAQSWMLLSKIACDDSLFPIDHWTAIERTHYMESLEALRACRPAVLAGQGRGDRPGRDVA